MGLSLKLLTPVLVVIVLSSCNTVTRFNPILTGYDEVDSILNIHFPKKGKQIYQKSLRPVADEFSVPQDLLGKGASFRKTYSFSKNDIDEIVSSLEKNNFHKFKHQTGCFICQLYNSDRYRTSCNPSEVPISSFKSERRFFGIEEDFLGSDFDVFIVHADSGIFIPQRYLIDQNRNNSFSHGFSRGVAISEERGVAIYWVQFW